MSYNGWSNWATWECMNYFSEDAYDYFTEARAANADADEACGEFVINFGGYVSGVLDTSLREAGLDSDMLSLAAEYERVDFTEIFNSFE